MVASVVSVAASGMVTREEEVRRSTAHSPSSDEIGCRYLAMKRPCRNTSPGIRVVAMMVEARATVRAVAAWVAPEEAGAAAEEEMTAAEAVMAAEVVTALVMATGAMAAAAKEAVVRCGSVDRSLRSLCQECTNRQRSDRLRPGKQSFPQIYTYLRTLDVVAMVKVAAEEEGSMEVSKHQSGQCSAWSAGVSGCRRAVARSRNPGMLPTR